MLLLILFIWNAATAIMSVVEGRALMAALCAFTSGFCGAAWLAVRLSDLRSQG